MAASSRGASAVYYHRHHDFSLQHQCADPTPRQPGSPPQGEWPMLLQLAVGVIMAYGGIVGLLYFTQRSLMY
ncbi:MAG: hypothetical protein WBW73_10530, partial [Rhodoplanes sp.]